MRELQLIGIVHRAAAPDWPAIAVHPDDVDVARPAGDALLENAGTLIDHRENHAFDDFLLRDRPPVEAEPGRGLHYSSFDLGIGCRLARSGIITKIALPGLLAEMSGFAKHILDRGAFAPPLADAPADIEPGEIHHRARPHREAEPDDRGIDFLRQRSFEQ